MPFITEGKTNLKYILIVIILAVIVGGGILAYYYIWIKDLETKLAELEKKLPEVQPPRKEQEERLRSSIFRITITRKPDSPEPGYDFLWRLGKFFGLPPDISYIIVADKREVEKIIKEKPEPLSRYSYPYYILFELSATEPIEVELKPRYEDGSVIVTVETVDKKLIPYIKDSDYCEIDADCVIRQNVCQYGAFNYYAHFLGPYTGCAGTFESGFECADPMKDPDECRTQRYDEKMGCEIEVEYIGVKCIENKCIAQNRIVKCLSR